MTSDSNLPDRYTAPCPTTMLCVDPQLTIGDSKPLSQTKPRKKRTKKPIGRKPKARVKNRDTVAQPASVRRIKKEKENENGITSSRSPRTNLADAVLTDIDTNSRIEPDIKLEVVSYEPSLVDRCMESWENKTLAMLWPSDHDTPLDHDTPADHESAPCASLKDDPDDLNEVPPCVPTTQDDREPPAYLEFECEYGKTFEVALYSDGDDWSCYMYRILSEDDEVPIATASGTETAAPAVMRAMDYDSDIDIKTAVLTAPILILIPQTIKTEDVDVSLTLV